jgi:hypothetical protein
MKINGYTSTLQKLQKLKKSQKSQKLLNVVSYRKSKYYYDNKVGITITKFIKEYVTINKLEISNKVEQNKQLEQNNKIEL